MPHSQRFQDLAADAKTRIREITARLASCEIAALVCFAGLPRLHIDSRTPVLKFHRRIVLSTPMELA